MGFYEFKRKHLNLQFHIDILLVPLFHKFFDYITYSCYITLYVPTYAKKINEFLGLSTSAIL